MLEQRTRCPGCGTFPWDREKIEAVTEICTACRKREIVGETIREAPKAEGRGAKVVLMREGADG